MRVAPRRRKQPRGNDRVETRSRWRSLCRPQHPRTGHASSCVREHSLPPGGAAATFSRDNGWRPPLGGGVSKNILQQTDKKKAYRAFPPTRSFRCVASKVSCRACFARTRRAGMDEPVSKDLASVISSFGNSRIKKALIFLFHEAIIRISALV